MLNVLFSCWWCLFRALVSFSSIVSMHKHTTHWHSSIFNYLRFSALNWHFVILMFKLSLMLRNARNDCINYWKEFRSKCVRPFFTCTHSIWVLFWLLCSNCHHINWFNNVECKQLCWVNLFFLSHSSFSILTTRIIMRMRRKSSTIRTIQRL